MIKIKLKEIAEITMGQSPQAEFVSSEKIGLPLLNGPAEFTDRFPIPVQYTSDSKRSAQKDDILFCVRGSTTGRMNIANQNYSIGRGLASLRHKSGSQLNIYIKALIETNLKKLLGGTLGSVFPNLTKDNLYDLECYTHNEQAQIKIASVLSALEDKIELNNKINAELEAIAKTLYDYWFVQFDFPNSEGKPYKLSGGEMVYNEVLKREIPKGWEVKSLGDYCKSKGGFAFKSNWWIENGCPVIKIKDIQENYTLDLSNLSSVSEGHGGIAKSFIAKAGNVVIAMTGATVGKFAIVPYTHKPLLVNQRVGFFSLGDNPTDKIAFLINSMRQNYFRETIFSLASGAAQPNISNDQINGITLLMPGSQIIENYNHLLAPVYRKVLNNQTQNQELASLRDWLLPMLMNGQVKVSGAESTVNEELGMVAEPSPGFKQMQNDL